MVYDLEIKGESNLSFLCFLYLILVGEVEGTDILSCEVGN